MVDATFAFNAHQWARLDVTPLMIRDALAERRERDRKYPVNAYTVRKNDARWLGVLHFTLFRAFIASAGLPLDVLSLIKSPSFAVAGQRVSLRAIKRSAQMKLSYGCQVTAEHIGKVATDWWFFSTFICERDMAFSNGGTFYLLGACTDDYFRQCSTLHTGGERITSSYRIRGDHAIKEVAASELVPARAWLTTMQKIMEPPAPPAPMQSSLLDE